MNVLSAYIRTFGGVKCRVYTPEETVAEIRRGKSLIRFGDGEFGIYQGHDIHYQPWSENLKKEFDVIKDDFESGENNCTYLLSVPKKYMQCSSFKLGCKRSLISSWAQSRLYFKNCFNRSLQYGDSFLFEKKNKAIYSQIWSQPGDDRTIVFVHNNVEYAIDFEHTYRRNTIYIPCPAYDSYSAISLIYDAIIEIVNNNRFTKEDVQIVLSAGPAGKIIAYRLSKIGYQCIDAGHCWDNPLES